MNQEIKKLENIVKGCENFHCENLTNYGENNGDIHYFCELNKYRSLDNYMISFTINCQQYNIAGYRKNLESFQIPK